MQRKCKVSHLEVISKPWFWTCFTWCVNAFNVDFSVQLLPIFSVFMKRDVCKSPFNVNVLNDIISWRGKVFQNFEVSYWYFWGKYFVWNLEVKQLSLDLEIYWNYYELIEIPSKSWSIWGEWVGWWCLSRHFCKTYSVKMEKNRRPYCTTEVTMWRRKMVKYFERTLSKWFLKKEGSFMDLGLWQF